MGVARPVAVAALGVVAVAASPAVSTGAAVLLAGLGLVGMGWAPAATLATVVAWSAGVAGPLAAPVTVAAVGALAWAAWRRSAAGHVGLGVAALAGVEALRQHAAATVLPAAVEPASDLLVRLVVAAGAVAAAGLPGEGENPRAHPRILAIGAMIAAGILGSHGMPAAWSYPADVARVAGTGDPDAREVARLALVRAAPDEDAAALATEGSVAIEAALDAGWRPWRACPSDTPPPRLSWWPRSNAGAPCGDEGALALQVAAALDRRGRGGEGLRLLGRHPRRGRVDWEMALFEAAQGEVVRWRGFVAPEADSLPGRVAWPLRFLGNGESTREMVAAWPLSELVVEGEGQAYLGPPTVGVLVDGAEVGRCAFDGAARCVLPVAIAAGPHRVRLLFDSDRTAADGDRNVAVVALSAR